MEISLTKRIITAIKFTEKFCEEMGLERIFENGCNFFFPDATEHMKRIEVSVEFSLLPKGNYLYFMMCSNEKGWRIWDEYPVKFNLGEDAELPCGNITKTRNEFRVKYTPAIHNKNTVFEPIDS